MTTTSRPPIRGRAGGTLAVLGAASIWGVTFTLTKPALGHFQPFQVAFLRTVFALPVLAALHVRSGRPLPSLRFAAPFAATGLVGYFMFTNLGLERTSAAVGAVIQGAGPALTAAIAIPALAERPTRAVAASVVLAGAGVAVMTSGTAGAAGSSAAGIALLGCATLSWAVYTVLGRRSASSHSAIQQSFLPAVLAAAVLAVPAALEGRPHAPASAWLLVVLLGLVGGGLAYPLWNLGVSRTPAAIAGVLSNASPVVAVAVAVGVLGEPVGGRELAGGLLVIAGALLVTRGLPEPVFEPQ